MPCSSYYYGSLVQLTLAVIIGCSDTSLSQILSSIEFKFREEQAPGSYVGNVGIASRLAASLTENELSRLKFNLPDSEYFRIDEVSGSLNCAVKIDREEVCDGQLVCKLTIEIIVYTRIGAGSYDILKVITVIVIILDINDNDPVFPSNSVSLTIPESNDLDQVLRTRSAIDKDTGENSISQYRFQDQSDTFRLSVYRNPDGSSYLGIVVKVKLDREVRDFYQVTIIAVDGGNPQRTGSVSINVTVTDMNDNVPEFTQNSYNETMQENMVVRTTVMKVTAVDKDAGKNAEISYQFSSRVPNRIRQKFLLDSHTGEIIALSNIDYEEDRLFQFIVEAVDHGNPQQTSRVNVNIHVIDMNDNPPQIVINLPPTGTEVAENELVGKFIAHISVADLDSGNNGLVTCSLNDENFALSKFSEFASNRYKVVLAKELDYEQNTYHRVTITCVDGGSPSLSNSTTFVVTVLDVNDNIPMFTESKYVETVLENQDGDEDILQVTAHDWDSGDSGKITYSIEDKYNGLFSIHHSTGVLTLLHTLDREYISMYEFNVVARDNGPQQLSSSAVVVVKVEDVNDEPPRFLNPVYFGVILENQPAGTSVGVASATDKDSIANSKMAYSIIQSGEDFKYFEIDTVSGVISSRVVFDREEKEYYHFVVQVVDPTMPSFSSTCNFTVRVLDDNDHSPIIRMTSDENATLFIDYSAPVGSLVTNIYAYDGDETSSQQSGLTFSIQKGDPNKLFDLDRYTGSLILARDITPKDLKTYNLIIVVQDGGSPPLYDTKLLSIKVNGTIPEVNEGGLSENIILAVIIVCVTVFLAVVIIVTILLIRKCDRRRRRKRANQKISEDKMYQLSTQEMYTDGPKDSVKESNNFGRKVNKEKLLEPNSAMPVIEVSQAAQREKPNNLRRPHLDEECRLIEILKRNDDEAASESGEDTDPSDSGRGGSEDETSHRGSGVDPEHGNKLHSQNYHRGAHSSSDSRNKYQPYHQQKFHPPKPASQSSASASKGKQQQSESSTRSPLNSVNSATDSNSSRNRASLNSPEMNTSPADVKKSSRNSANYEQLSNQPRTFQTREDNPARGPENNSINQKRDQLNKNNSALQSFNGQSNSRFQPGPPRRSLSKERLAHSAANRSYAPTRQYKYSDRAYPLSDRMNSPDEDDKTTTSGSYTINPDELHHEMRAMVLHDTVV